MFSDFSSPNLKEVIQKFIITGDGEKLAYLKIIPKSYNINLLKETLVLIPGFCAILSPWKIMIQNLIDFGYSIIIFETREKKSSSATSYSKRYSIDGYQKDIEDFFNQIKIKRPFSLVGISLGSGVAIRYSIYSKSRENFPRKLVLIDAIYTAEHFNMMINLSFRSYKIFKSVIKAIIFTAPILMRKIRKTDELLYNKRITTLQNADLRKMQVALRSAKNSSIEQEICFVPIPSLVVGIANDKEHPLDQAIKTAQLIPRCKFILAKNNKSLHGEFTALNIALFLQEI